MSDNGPRRREAYLALLAEAEADSDGMARAEAEAERLADYLRHRRG